MSSFVLGGIVLMGLNCLMGLKDKHCFAFWSKCVLINRLKATKKWVLLPLTLRGVYKKTNVPTFVSEKVCLTFWGLYE